METLKVIQTLAKIGKILSKIVFICCIVGACGCVVGIISLAAGIEALKFGGIELKSILQNEAGVSASSLYCCMAAGIFLCAGEGVVAKFAEIYFKNELLRGTPFDLAVAKELFRLGIITVCVPLGALILAEITQGIMTAAMQDAVAMDISEASSIGVGLTFMVCSFLCRLGAEQNGQFAQEVNDTSRE